MKRQSGFTIVETLIVLAVAGLILLVVFGAIPALQRNSRNNQRRQDVQTVLEAVTHYELNNSGNLPSTNDLDAALQNRLTYYDPTTENITITPTTAANGIHPITNTTSNANLLDRMQLYNHAKCDPDNLGAATNAGAGYNDVVALYAIERAGGHALQCQQL